MNRPLFAIIFIAIVVVIFLGMWFGWRARARRDAGVSGAASAPLGELLAHYPRVLYVSTTPEGQPLVRVAAPGLRYRGYAELTVRRDGVTIAVAGESPVHLSQEQVLGSATAGVRVGKAVERGGLSLLRWSSEGRTLESSFRFDSDADHRAFADAITALTAQMGEAARAPESSTDDTTDANTSTQEDAR